ncbi:hypothetical protein C1Y11_04400 [Pseudomonas sp. FW305-20]|nr:hypothetical protein C1Y11_04400 [Pseudomonas sp. FW305-20]PMU20075.1 hypothetical protein C1Y10_08155 [Pseudomonas sp. FW305-122]
MPPLGCEADPKSLDFQDFVSAAHSNGGKPPRHKSLPQGIARFLPNGMRSVLLKNQAKTPVSTSPL